MKEFDLKYRDICLHVACKDNQEQFIKQHFVGNLEIDDSNTTSPTFTLVSSDHSFDNTGLYAHLTDPWFDNACLDCQIDNLSKTCYISNIAGSTPQNEVLLLKAFVENLFNRLLELKGYIALHASAIDKNGRGLMFVAGRNSGKTVSLLNMLHEGYDYVTNDKLAVASLPEHIDGHGIPQTTSIRMSPQFLSDPRNQKYLDWARANNFVPKNENMLEGNNIILSTSELIALNNCLQLHSTSISSTVSPVYSPNIARLRMLKLSPKQTIEILTQNKIPLVHTTKQFLQNIHLDFTSEKSQDALNDLSQLPTFIVEQNEKTRDEFVYEMEKLIND